MMKKLVLIGGGGHCKSVLDAALRSGEYSEIVITDPEITVGTEICGCKVVGTDEMLPNLLRQGYGYAFITVGSITNPSLRIKLAGKAKALGFIFPIISDPSAVVSEYAHVGAGTFIGKNVVVNTDTMIGEHCIINTGCIIEHECQVGDFAHISVGSILCGNVKVGKESFIGAGSTVIQGIKIGNQTIVGANSTILTDMEDHMKVNKFVTNRGGGIA